MQIAEKTDITAVYTAVGNSASYPQWNKNDYEMKGGLVYMTGVVEWWYVCMLHCGSLQPIESQSGARRNILRGLSGEKIFETFF